MGEETGKGGGRRLLPAFKSDKHFRVVFLLLRVFFPVLLLFFFSVCVRAKRGRGAGWCDKAAGGNLISFSVYFAAAFCFACFSLSESETEAQINKTFSAVEARLKIYEFLVKIPDSHFTFHVPPHTYTHTLS